MIEIRLLNKNDSTRYFELMKEIERGLTDEKWWLPLQQIAKDNLFEKKNTIVVGAFDDGRLIASSALFLNSYEYGDTARKLGIDISRTAEIGRCMVLPEYRNKNLMLTLNGELLKIARLNSLKYIVATAHPENISSCKSLMRLGMKYQCTVNKFETYPRNIYMMEI